MFLVLILSGCAGFKGKQLDPVNTFPEARVKPSVQTSFELKQSVNDGPTTLFPETAEEFRHIRLIRTFRKTELFQEVGTNLNEPDLSVSVKLETRAHINYFSTFLTGLTLYLIPSQVTDEFQLQAEVQNREGRVWTIHLEDHVTLWQHITLLPVMPFKTVPGAMIEVQENMYRHLIQEMLQRNIIQVTEAETLTSIH